MGQQMTTLALKEIVIDRNLNPRLELDKETVEQYMQMFDDLPPVIVFDTERGNVLVDGFHRHQAAKALGHKELAVDMRRGSYREAIEFAALANLKHGKPLTTRERSKVAETLLLLHSGEWSDREIARRVGCSHPAVANTRRRLEAEGKVVIITTIQSQHDKKAEPDPELPGPWAECVLAGDVFDRLAELEDGAFDLVFVDPPYGILQEEWDRFGDTGELLAFTERWLDAVVPKLKPTGRLYVCYSQWYVHLLRSLMTKYEGECGLRYSNTLVWYYKNVLTKPNNRAEYKISHEPVLYYRGKDAPDLDFSVYGEEQGDVWEIATPQSNFHEGKEHPAQKPLELLRRIIATGCPQDGLILDPFAGSGTTAVAAFEMARAFKVIERNPAYVQTIKERLNQARNKSEQGASHLMALANV